MSNRYNYMIFQYKFSFFHIIIQKSNFSMDQNFNFFYQFLPQSNSMPTFTFLPPNSIQQLINTPTFFHSPNYFPSPPNSLTFYSNKSEKVKSQQEDISPVQNNFPSEKKQEFDSRIKISEQKEVKQEEAPKQKALQPKTKHKVTYFDPLRAPLITSEKYFLINDLGKKKVKAKRSKKSKQRKYNQCEHCQSDSNPFIVFRNRRIKKKYRKYMKEENEQIPLFDDEVLLMKYRSHKERRRKMRKQMKKEKQLGMITTFKISFKIKTKEAAVKIKNTIDLNLPQFKFQFQKIKQFQQQYSLFGIGKLQSYPLLSFYSSPPLLSSFTFLSLYNILFFLQKSSSKSNYSQNPQYPQAVLRLFKRVQIVYHFRLNECKAENKVSSAGLREGVSGDENNQTRQKFIEECKKIDQFGKEKKM